MLNFRNLSLTILYVIKSKVSAAKLYLGKKLGLIRSVMIMPYRGFGNSRELFFPGRVLRDRGIGISRLDDSSLKNFSKMYKRFMTWEIPFVKVSASFDNNLEYTFTDEEGYFTFHLSAEVKWPENRTWKEIELTLEDRILKNMKKVQSVTRVYLSFDDSDYGIISDIDDTIVPTGSTRIWEMLKTTFFRNAHSRIPFPGVSAFYKALSKGISGEGHNPLFYVSSSPWNLYDFLIEFMEVHDIPAGPLMLRDIGLSKEHFFSGSHAEHKMIQVKRILTINAGFPFILIGDSGQQDAEIYLQVIKDFPGRVKMVYIRDVSPQNHSKVMKIAEEVKHYGTEMLLVNDTFEAATHAYSRSWITEGSVDQISQKKADMQNK